MTSHDTCLPEQTWQHMADKHRQTARHWTVPCRKRRATGNKHPVHDFLFTYYPFSLGRLEQWHPGLGTSLEISPDSPLPSIYRGKHYTHSDGKISLDPTTLSEKQLQRIRWIHNLLVLTQNRKPIYGCHGLHEWAMVYQGGDIRHRESAPLRFTQEKIDRIVESRPITCSHFDAYRFFTPNAIPLNKLKPTLDTREHNEQPACLHTNMDLYKWTSKTMPWTGSDLLWKTFLLALKTRELDMRASPYDLSQYGYTPIKIETPEGRAAYEQQQRQIATEATTLRATLITKLTQLIKTHHPT